jgi:LmbE family N-acetylglucosaminyl deacetylase
MVKNNEGLTKTYNRFHDPEETSPDILKLRQLHDAMDRAVLDAYGWTDIQPTCEFLLDYEDEEDEGGEGTGRRRKKPWRYRWPDDIRDEVLARLLALNAQRAQEERQQAALQQAVLQQAAESPGTHTKPKRGRKPRASGPSLPLSTERGEHD